MKMKPEHFTALQDAIRPILSQYPNSLQTYLDNGKTEMRWRWDVFHTACDRKLFDRVSLYGYLDDSNIDTALRHATGTK